MRKKILIIILVVLLLSSIIGIGVYTKIKNQESSMVSSNIIDESSEEIELLEEIQNSIDDDNEIIEDHIVLEETQEQEKSQEPVIEQPKQVEQPKQEQKKVDNKPVSQTTSSQVSEPTPEPQIQETEKPSVAVEQEKPKENVETQSSIPTKKETPYWCVDGGTHHIAGDAPNEHGYYSSWDEAYSALEEYTKNLTTSYNYKVNSCACGLYYFWVQQ